MAQAATMGPPLSPRETRRSGRRSAPSVSASASKSPDSDQPPPRDKGPLPRVPSSSSSSRSKKLKQEDYDEPVDDRKQQALPSNASSGSNSSTTNNSNNNKAKRKPKEKQSGADADEADGLAADNQGQDPAEEEEEQGITRCVCGSAEDDPDAGEFMVQCETCKVWQHGLCMGYTSEDQVHDDDYYCELCKPEMHTELLKKLARKPRHSSSARQDPSASSRVSRSHSPSQLLKQTSKRRNTMNSRDAAFDESLKEIIEATAAEAAAVNDVSLDEPNAQPPDSNDGSKKKRKRTEEETSTKKRTRSASTASDAQVAAVVAPPDPPPSEKAPSQPPKASVPRNKRGARKAAIVDVPAPEPEEVVPSVSSKRPSGGQRSKNANAPKRPTFPPAVSQGSALASHEHGTRRNQGTGGHQSGSTAADARAYRHSHAYAVSQQALFTSWNLPDYLSHLEQMLPTDTPRPLEVRSGVSVAADSRGDSSERTMERGVKVKWPAKRMSVGDMNKRVRSLVEWVGREQANAQDRNRRREALEKALREQAEILAENTAAANSEDVVMMDQDNVPEPALTKSALTGQLMSESALETSAQTMKMMEELMEELIGFQERFGPGAKSRERERRLAA